MNVQIEESWKARLEPEFEKDYFHTLTDFVREEYSHYPIYPPGKLIFNAFNLCPFDKVKVVIIGQDPYHGPGQAHGLCFSVNDGVRFPPSLINIFKEIKDDMLEKDIFLDKFSTDEFMLEFESTKFDEDTYFVNMTYDVKMPMQYSDSAIEKVYTEGIVAEDKLQIEYILLSTIAIRDIINGNFKDSYIAEFTTSLFKKKQKLEGILSLLGNEALV